MPRREQRHSTLQKQKRVVQYHCRDSYHACSLFYPHDHSGILLQMYVCLCVSASLSYHTRRPQTSFQSISTKDGIIAAWHSCSWDDRAEVHIWEAHDVHPVVCRPVLAWNSLVLTRVDNQNISLSICLIEEEAEAAAPVAVCYKSKTHAYGTELFIIVIITRTQSRLGCRHMRPVQVQPSGSCFCSSWLSWVLLSFPGLTFNVAKLVASSPARCLLF